MRFLLAILFLLPGAGWSLRAQDLTGQWTGGSADNLSEKKQKIVLNIAAGDYLFGGVLHWYFPETQLIRHYMVGGRFHSRDSVLSFMEDSVAGDRLSIPGPVDRKEPGLSGIYTLRYKRMNHKEVLEGHWSSPVKDNAGNSLGMSIRLEKKAPPFIPFVPLPHKKKDSAQQKLLAGLQERQSPTLATIPVRQQDSVRIQLYDNGEIDGDSVSLYLNNELILTHVKLQAEPKTIWIVIDKSLPVNKL